MDSIEKGIVQLISEHGIKWLCMGAAANKSYSRYIAKIMPYNQQISSEQHTELCIMAITHSAVDLFILI